ncbi:helical backbone metal receptor [Solimonas marina]|uniref:ABC transporter substrate-binding protein n=1 Tax=Solimonas marina TaxID=2714601 RepID=A0A970B4L9_9GAMM|nr:helical backbone metal receptor [Solimonas marina]NKF20690.1 ABC transporter substrate-binding protein [Solimonas marina]
MRVALSALLLLLGGALAPPALAAERIVTLAPHLAELVCAVQACGELVGVSAYTDAPPRAAALPQVGSAFSVNYEAVLALQPTRVLAWGGGTPPATIQRLRDLGLNVEVVSIDDLDGIAGALESLGADLGHAEAGEAAADAYRDRLQALRARYADRPRLRVFYQIESAPAYTVNGESPISTALDLCGADNVFSSLPALSSVVSPEAVLAADPDAVVYAADEDRRGIAAFWAKLDGARAADPSRQVVVDANALTRQSPRVLDGIEQLCEGLDRVRRDAR